MNWFTRMCRQTGLLLHRSMPGPLKAPPRTVHCVTRTEEERPTSKITLRRTTIEEVEIDEGAELRKDGSQAFDDPPKGNHD